MTEPSNAPTGKSSEPMICLPAVNACAYLLVLSGEAVGHLFMLTESRYVIGRFEEATLRLYDDGIGSRHAELRKENGSVILTVLDEDAETYVNGKPVV